MASMSPTISVPESGFTRVATAEMRVVLPAPLGPSSAVRQPFSRRPGRCRPWRGCRQGSAKLGGFDDCIAPIGANVFLFAQRYNVAEAEVTASIAVSTAMALVTLPVVMFLVSRFVTA